MPDKVEDIDDALSFDLLQHVVNGDEGPSATNTSAEGKGEGEGGRGEGN